jgi:hypothetical protein
VIQGRGEILLSRGVRLFCGRDTAWRFASLRPGSVEKGPAISMDLEVVRPLLDFRGIAMTSEKSAL